MTPQTHIRDHRPASKRRQPALAACLALILALCGCTRLQLSQFQRHAARGDHAWIAAQTVACREPSDGCSRLHLAKGDACLRLARMSREPAVNFACAADELETGLDLKPSWNTAGVELIYRENLCGSLESLHGYQSGKPAEQTVGRLSDAAKALYQLAPESLPAVYYLARARLMEIERMLPNINAATRVPVCLRLKRTVNRVLANMENAKGGAVSDWDRFAGDYQRLAFELGVAMQAAECR